MEHEKIERISELTRISRERELTPEEQTERAALRKEYLDAFREGMRATLEGVVIQHPDGSREKLKQKTTDDKKLS